jgi:hypothetical protein
MPAKNTNLIQLRVSEEFFAEIFRFSSLDRRTVAQFVRLAVEDRVETEKIKRNKPQN